MKAAIEEHFTPEFLNRIDRIVYFTPLDQDVLLRIFDREFEAVAARLRAQGIQVEVTDAFKRALCKKYTDPTRGARRLQRGIEDEIVNPLTDKLLAGEIKPGMRVVVGEGMALEVSDAPELAEPEQASPPPARSPVPPPALAAHDTRDKERAQNEQAFEREFEALAARLRARGIQVEVTAGAREFLCDPFWTERSLRQALQQLVEEPLLQQLEKGDIEAGDRVRVERYADHLEFKAAGGEE